MKKVLSFILTLAIVVAAVPLGAFTFTVSAEKDGFYTYTVSGDKAKITRVDTSISGDITIPSTLGGYPVTSIGESAFRECSSLTGAIIPNGVISIGKTAFYQCSSLINITIPNSVTSIGRSAFNSCFSLTSITIPNSVTNIGDVAFYSCSRLTSITIPNSVTNIGDKAFYSCSSLTSITIPNSVTNIGDNAFYNCENLTDVWYEGCENDKANISIGTDNNYLRNSTWHYYNNYSADCDESCNFCGFVRETNMAHTYDGDCDIVCDTCGSTRTITHTYDNDCDTECNICGDKRVPSDHVYDNNCDTICNVCDASRTITHTYNNVCDASCNICGDIRVPSDHVYDNTCDAVCNVCDASRTITHTYDNACDAECNICGDKRVPSDHVYDNNCDTICNVCDASRTITHTYNNACDASCNICGDTRVPSDHVYDNTCDAICNVCDASRTITHTYDNACDAECNICGDTRVPSDHIYDNTCDAICNVCNASRTITHTYDNACDAECNICGNTRITSEHVYDDIYDTDCNVCGTTRQLTSISISVLPSKIVYTVGEAFDNSGMVVNAYYSDGTSGVVTRYAVVGFDSSTAGTKIVNVTYGGRITQFAVTILALEFSGASLTLQNDIIINYMVDKTAFDSAGYTNPYVEFEFNGKKTIKRAYSTEDGMYIFHFNNIVPSQINDTVKATLYAEYNGVVYSGKVSEYSVAKYCYTMLSEYAESDNAELKTLLVDLLNYGTAAQIYTDYNTASLANASLTDEQAAWGTETADELNDALNAKYEEIESPAVKWKSVGLNLKDSVSIRFKIAAESCDNLTVKVTSESGQEWTVLRGDFDSAGNGCYYVYFENLSAYQMREKIYVTVYDGDTAVSNTLCYSIESYVYAVQSGSDENLKNLLDAMIKYGDSAYNYKQSMG